MKTIRSVLPGRLLLGRGTWREYLELERFHYRAGRPATVAGVWIVRYFAPRCRNGTVVAAAVLSYPTLACAARDSALGLERLERTARIRFVNANVRTISRVVVHPTFRSLGLARRLVMEILRASHTRFVEAMAVMGRTHRFFDAAGMRRFEPREPNARRPVYFLRERQGCR